MTFMPLQRTVAAGGILGGIFGIGIAVGFTTYQTAWSCPPQTIKWDDIECVG